MAKHKAQTSTKDARPTKKGNELKKENSESWKEQYNVPDNNHKGKNTSDDCNKNFACQSVKIETLSPELLDENQKVKKEELPNMELNRLLQSKSKLNLMGSVSWKTYLFPSVLNKVLSPQKKCQYFGLDLVEDEKERTIWTHKASVWTDLFKTTKEFAQTGRIETISEMFNGTLTCAVRDKPKGPNEIHSFVTQKGQNIQHWILLVPMPADIDPAEYIPQFLSCFQHLCNKLFIRSAYKSGV